MAVHHKEAGPGTLARNGWPPDVGHEVLWLLGDCLSDEVLLARSLLTGTEHDLAILIREVKRNLRVPIVGAISDGQRSVRKAVAGALPKAAHHQARGCAADLGTRVFSSYGRELALADLETWPTLRAGLETRRHTCVLRKRFRRNPQAYLLQLEARWIKRTWPP